MSSEFNWDNIRSSEDIFNFGKNQMRHMKINWKKGSLLFMVIIAAVVVFSASSAFFTIEADEVGVVTLFGRYNRTVDPGLHFKIPFGVETFYPVKVKRVFKEEFGFRTQQPGIRTEYSPQKFLDESLMLTGDLNAVEVEWIIQFSIKDAKNFLFNLEDSIEFLDRVESREPISHATVRDMSQAVMRQVVGDYSVDEVITVKGAEIEVLVKDKFQAILDRYQSGVYIREVKLQDVNPPGAVKAAFNEVNQAKQEKEKMINQAWEVYNRIIPEAKGLAEKKILEAEGYSQERVNQAKGDASAFESVLVEYLKAKDVTRKRLYLETMSKVLPAVEKKYIVDESSQGVLPLLPLGNVVQGGAQ